MRNDTEIIKDIQSGDVEAKEELWEKYAGAVQKQYYTMLKKFQNSSFEKEDFVQNAYVLFEEVLATVDPSRVKCPERWTFNSFFYKKLYKLLCLRMVKREAKRSEYEITQKSYQECVHPYDGRSIQDVARIDNPQFHRYGISWDCKDSSQRVGDFLNTLSEEERWVIERRKETGSMMQVAEEIGVPYRKIQAQIVELKRRASQITGVHYQYS